jgi:hypothetical protein
MTISGWIVWPFRGRVTLGGEAKEMRLGVTRRTIIWQRARAEEEG